MFYFYTLYVSYVISYNLYTNEHEDEDEHGKLLRLLLWLTLRLGLFY